MRREGKGGSKGSHGGLGVLVSQSWAVTQGRVQLGWEPGGGKLPHHWHPVQPPDLLGGVRHCPWLLTFPPSCSPGGTSSASGSRESCSGCSSECTKGKGFRSRNLKLPHFSLSQMMVRLGEGVSGLGVQTRAGVSHSPLSLLSGKFAHHPLPARSRLWPALAQADPTVSTGQCEGDRAEGSLLGRLPAHFGWRWCRFGWRRCRFGWRRCLSDTSCAPQELRAALAGRAQPLPPGGAEEADPTPDLSEIREIAGSSQHLRQLQTPPGAPGLEALNTSTAPGALPPPGSLPARC